MSTLEKPMEHEKEGSPSARILLINDNLAGNELICRTLTKKNHSVTLASNGEEALCQFAPTHYDLVILNAQLPGISGYDVCRELRKSSDVPIIFLSAAHDADSIVRALNYGADAYIAKPFTAQELSVRVHALIRRTLSYRAPLRSKPLRHDYIVLDEERQEVRVRNKLIHLTTTEFRLLRYFIKNPGRPISTQELLKSVWEYDSVPDLNLIRVTISRLRSKIEENSSNPRYLKTIRKFGYRFLASKAESKDDQSETPTS